MPLTPVHCFIRLILEYNSCMANSLRMFLLLVRVRLNGALNLTKKTWIGSPLFAIALVFLGVSLFVAIYLGFHLFFQLAAHLQVLSETAFQLLGYLFLFLFAGSVPFVASTLLQSGDYNLLFSSPIPPRAVMAAKLLDATIANSLQFTAIGTPAIVACAATLPMNFLSWLLLPLLIVLFVLTPALLTALILLTALLLIGVKKARASIAALNGVMAAGVCITIVLEVNHLPIKPTMEALHSSFAASSSVSPLAHTIPSALFADYLTHIGSPGGTGLAMLAFGKIIALNTLLFGSCLLLGGKLLSAANLSDEEIAPPASRRRLKTSGEFRPNSPIASERERGWSPFSDPITGIMAKDWKYLFRDSVLLSQLAMPMILVVVPFVLEFQAPELRNEISLFTSAIVGVVLFMQTSILSLTSIGLESQGFWVALTAPIDGMTFLKAKFLFCTLLSAGAGLALTLITGLFFRLSPSFLLLQIFFVACSSAGLCGLGVGLSALFPRFVYENPAHRVSAWGLILGFFVYIAYVFISGSLFAADWLITSKMTDTTQILTVNMIGASLYLVFTWICVYAPLAMGAKRIENYEWLH